MYPTDVNETLSFQTKTRPRRLVFSLRRDPQKTPETFEKQVSRQSQNWDIFWDVSLYILIIIHSIILLSQDPGVPGAMRPLEAEMGKQ